MGLLYELCRIMNCYNRVAVYVYIDIGDEGLEYGKEIQPSVTTVIGPRAMIIITNLYHDSVLLAVPLYTSTQHLIQGQPTRSKWLLYVYCLKIQHL